MRSILNFFFRMIFQTNFFFFFLFLQIFVLRTIFNWFMVQFCFFAFGHLEFQFQITNVLFMHLHFLLTFGLFCLLLLFPLSQTLFYRNLNTFFPRIYFIFIILVQFEINARLFDWIFKCLIFFLFIFDFCIFFFFLLQKFSQFLFVIHISNSTSI